MRTQPPLRAGGSCEGSNELPAGGLPAGECDSGRVSESIISIPVVILIVKADRVAALRREPNELDCRRTYLLLRTERLGRKFRGAGGERAVGWGGPARRRGEESGAIGKRMGSMRK